MQTCSLGDSSPGPLGKREVDLRVKGLLIRRFVLNTEVYKIKGYGCE